MTADTEPYADRLQVAKDIAAALGEGWSADWWRNLDGEPGFHGRYLVGPDVTLFVREDKGKLSITADIPKGASHPYGSDRPTIGVSVSRGPEAIATEIKRRLLDDARAYWTKAVDNAARDIRDQENRDAAAAKIAAVHPGHFRVEQHPSSGGSCDVRLYGMADGAHGTAMVSATGVNVTIEIRSLPLAVAIKVLRAAGQEGTG